LFFCGVVEPILCRFSGFALTAKVWSTPSAGRPSEALVRYQLGKICREFGPALRHIERHLDERLRLADPSALAHSSPFHFHRRFASGRRRAPRKTKADLLKHSPTPSQ
jgi:hypothetical protein